MNKCPKCTIRNKTTTSSGRVLAYCRSCYNRSVRERAAEDRRLARKVREAAK